MKFHKFNESEWEVVPFTDFMCKKGSNIQNDMLFNFLDTSHLNPEEGEKRYNQTIDYAKRHNTYELFVEPDFLFLDLKETFDQNIRKRIKIVNGMKTYSMDKHYDIPMLGNLVFTRNEIIEYKFIKKHAIKCLYEPLVILSTPDACSKSFAISNKSKLIPYIFHKELVPVDLVFQENKVKEWQKYIDSIDINCYYVTTMLAYIYERLYLKKVNATLTNPGKYILYLPTEYRRSNKNEFLMQDEDLGNEGKLEKLDITKLGMFSDYMTAFTYYASIINKDLLISFPLVVNESDKCIYIGAKKEKELIGLSSDIIKALFNRNNLKNNNIPDKIKEVFKNSISYVNMQLNKEYKHKKLVCIKLSSLDSNTIF